MKFRYQELDIQIDRTDRSRGEGCLWTEYVRATLAQAIRERKPARVEFDGQDVQARNNPRLDSLRSMRFLLDGELLAIPHWKIDGRTGRSYR